MKVLIVAPGSTGDVAPLAGLGARLHREGHDVAVAAHEPFRPLVTTAGLEFRALRGDPAQQGASPEGQRWQRAGNGPIGAARIARLFVDYIDEMSGDVIAAARRGADVMLLNAVAVFTGYHVAEGLGIPSAGLFPAPLHPTGEFPPLSVRLPSLTAGTNRASARAVLAAGAASFGRTTRTVRTQLGLPPMKAASLWRRMDAEGWPAFCGFSESVLPRPADWPDPVRVTGYWWPPAPDRPLPAALDAFLDAGPPPVFIGLGSRNVGDPDAIGTTIRDALRRAGLRGVVQAGWAGLDVTDDEVITIGEQPHELLFPRMAAVAHHCGAGTTAAGLRAGVPTVGLPVLADQPFWAARLVALGARPAAIPLKRLTADGLADALSVAVRDDRYRSRAQQLSRAITAEDGAGRVAAALGQLR